MTRKLPPEAFSFYIGLGVDRTYKAVADHYKVSERTVSKAAARERWQEMAADAERRGRELARERAIETFEDVTLRHLKTVRIIQSKALETLKRMPLAAAMEAVRALDIGIKHERLILGEPSERTAISIEDKIKQEYERWLSVEAEATTDGDADQPSDQ